jgi:hypothetical protein
MSEKDLLGMIVPCSLQSSEPQTIGHRLKESFPTDKEADLKWAKDDPMGHFEAHKKDKNDRPRT